jgi:hypothetical protein
MTSRLGENLPLTLFFDRPTDLSSYQIIREASGKWPYAKPSTIEARDQFIARLITEVRGTDDVRAARRWVNGVIGPERLAVIVCAIWFATIFLIRDFLLIPHILHSGLVKRHLDAYSAKYRRGLPPASNRAEFAASLWWNVTQGRTDIAPSDNVVSPIDERVRINTISTRILRSAVLEMQSLSNQQRPLQGDPNYIETVAFGERQDVEHSRMFFDAMLPTFPAIGFIGTVSSLLVAMSKADRIVSTLDPSAKGLAAGQVTDILSLCFSTTFMALLCVLIFSPLVLAQRSREDQIIDETEAAVQVHLRPQQQ